MSRTVSPPHAGKSALDIQCRVLLVHGERMRAPVLCARTLDCCIRARVDALSSVAIPCRRYVSYHSPIFSSFPRLLTMFL